MEGVHPSLLEARPAEGAYRMRKAVNAIMIGLCASALGIAALPLVSLLWLVVSNGIGSLSIDFFTNLPTPVGEVGGGIGNAIVGSIYMVGLASLLGIPVGVGAGIYLAERGGGRFGQAVRATAELLASVPSIVIGVVAYGIVVSWMHHFSALAGGLALAILMIPSLARSTEEMIHLVPNTMREASLALGVPAWKTSLFVILPIASAGIMNAALLAIARAAGETAPLLFTALNNQYWNFDPTEPTASLTVQIYNYAISPYEDWHSKAWGAALCLLIMVGGLGLLARFVGRRRLS